MKRSKIILFLFTIVALILLLPSFYVMTNFAQLKQTDSWGATIIVNEVSEKPQAYFSLENPDSYVSEAISNPGQYVFVHFFNNTEIDELVETHDTSNIEYNGHYYSVDLLYADPGPVIGPELVTTIVIAWIMYGLSIIAVAVILVLLSRKPHLQERNTKL